MDKKQVRNLTIILSLVLITLIVLIFIPFSGDEEQSRIPEDVDVFDYQVKDAATCYIANEDMIAFIERELSEFPNLDVSSILFQTEDFEILHALVEHEDCLIGIIVDLKTGELVWNKSEFSLSDMMPEELP